MIGAATGYVVRLRDRPTLPGEALILKRQGNGWEPVALVKDRIPKRAISIERQAYALRKATTTGSDARQPMDTFVSSRRNRTDGPVGLLE